MRKAMKWAAVAGVRLAAAASSLRQKFWGGRRNKVEYLRRLEQSQGYLQQHIAKLDSLVAMLADIYRLGMDGTGTASRGALCEAIVKNTCRLLKARKGSLLLLQEAGHRLTVAASVGLSPDTAVSGVWLGEGVIGRVAQTGKPITVEDIRADTRFLREPQTPWESQVMASVPLRVKDRVVGVLNVNGDDGHPFEARELRLLGILADQAAITLENFELCENLRNFNVDLARTLVQALDAK